MQDLQKNGLKIISLTLASVYYTYKELKLFDS